MDQILSNVIQQQQTGLDPFAQAHAQQDAKAQAQTQLIGGPMDMTAQPAQAAQIQQTASGDVDQSYISKMLQKLGVDDKGLTFNDLGRVQLIGRLRDKFGVNYQSNSDAVSALGAFDKFIQKTPMDNSKKLATMTANSERSLSALLGTK